ncbi:MAG: AEC family transporter [Betaproteobacteria bacterium]|nr:MAG: AEC family transporter [Betaproteobacteria bacterium]
MLDILALTTPIYVLILLGYVLTRLGLFAKAEMRVFGKFVINLALPALLFRALSQRELGDILNLTYLLGYFLGSLAMIGLGYLWFRRFAGQGPTASAIGAMGVSCSNSGYVGYPILLLTLAPVAGVSLALNMVVENLLIIPLLLFLADRERAGADKWRSLARSLARLARNPLILGMLAGLSVPLLGLTLPAPAIRTMDMLAAACSGLALFVVGGTLVGVPLQGFGMRLAPIVLGKLILHPMLVFLAISALPLLGFGAIDPTLVMAAVLLAAMPMMGIYPTLAQAYGQEEFSAVALLVTTFASFFTLSGVLWVLGQAHRLA